METSIGLMLLLQVILIILNAIFACAEIAVISMNDNKLAKMAAAGDKRAVRLARLTSKPAKFLATIQVAITLSGFMGSAFAADNFSGKLVQLFLDAGAPISAQTLEAISVILITLILSYFTLVFGELVPKRVAMRKAEPLALALSGLISVIAKVFAPIVWFLTASTNGILRLLRIDPNGEDDEVSEEEIRMMVDVGSEKGAIDPGEKEFIQNVFEFDDLTAGEISTHRTDISVLYLEDSPEEWAKLIHDSRHSLFPVCDDSVDNITGILNAKDYYRLEDKSRENILNYAMRPVYFVPESIKADILFRNMKESRNHFAVVLDEYGGTAGIITMNDLIEQLIGEFDDEERTKPTSAIEQLEENRWKIPGSASIDSVSKALSLNLSCDKYDTFAGLIFNALGTIPEDGTALSLKTDDLLIDVVKIKDHRIEETLVSKQTPQDK
ncbi:MAG: hemolysin family protein [Anaerovoracaceae bacterium]